MIHCLTAGGASLATIAAAANPSVRARILSLTPSEPAGRSLAASADLQVIECSSFDHALNELGAADIVHAHVWNAPELYEVLRAALPPVRLLMWVHVAGRALPQVISPAIVARADVVVATSTRCLQHIEPAGRMCRLAPRLILPTRDLAKFENLTRVPTGAFTVGYVGNIDKLSMNVVDLCARMKLPNASFLFVGNGRHRKALEQQADALDNRRAFRFVGFQEDVTPFLTELDVFGYPMSPTSFASMDLSLIEAMSAGVPAVVLSPDGTCDGIRTGVDGYTVGSEEEYIARIAELASQHERRKAMARAARANTLEKFSLPRLWQSFDRIDDELLSLPKRPRPALEWANERTEGQTATRGADAMLFAFGATWPALAASFSAEQDRAVAADLEIAVTELDSTTGGLLHYLNRYPTDPWLLFWRALSFAGQGHYVRALANLESARRHRFPDQERLNLYRDILRQLCEQRGADPVSSLRRFGDCVQERIGRCDVEPH